MSMTAIPFAVDIEKVRAVFGCKDDNLIEQIKTAELYDHYSTFSDDSADATFKKEFDNALRYIVFNYLQPEERRSEKSKFWGLVKSKPPTGLNENIGYVYGYVLLVICDYFGTHLLPDCDGFYWGRTFKAAVAILKEKGLQVDLENIIESRELFDIPKIADFPAINYFTKGEIEHINAIMAKIEIDESKCDYDSDEFDEVQDMLINIRDSFRACEEQNVEMVTFTH